MRLEDKIKREALSRGYALAGITQAKPPDNFGRYLEWLERGYAGEMNYLARSVEWRRDARSVLAEVRSIMMLALPYDPTPLENGPHLARYARSADYHRVVWDSLNELSDWLAAEVPGTVSLGVTDSAPLLERDLARRAGLGWFGKNTMLISPRTGSYFVLAAFLMSLELQPDPPFTANHCGTCTACLDACPTGALLEPGWLDSRKCISYLTIELRKLPAPELRPAIGDWLAGCDICQEVCPWNRFAPPASPLLTPRAELLALDPVELLGLDETAFRARFRQTALFRLKRSGLLRNAAIILGNRKSTEALPALRRATHDTDPIIREAAEWAIDQIERVQESG